MAWIWIIMFAWIGLAEANVTPPFSTTYDCAEQAQDPSDGSWTITCDGIKAAGAWETSLGAGEQITSSANYASGGGGRGQRHCMEAHVKTNGSGTGIVQWWVDSTLRLDKSNVDFLSPYGGFGGFIIPSNGVFTTVGGADMYEDIDDVAIQTTGPIGCLAGGGGGGGKGGMDIGTIRPGQGKGKSVRMVSHGAK